MLSIVVTRSFRATGSSVRAIAPLRLLPVVAFVAVWLGIAVSGPAFAWNVGESQASIYDDRAHPDAATTIRAIDSATRSVRAPESDLGHVYDVSVDSYATNTAPPIEPGASGGPSAGKPFGPTVKDSAVAENLTATGGDVPTCVWCRMETPSPHIDHARPLSLGGTATLENAQVSCPHCNMSRGNRPAPVTPPSGYEGSSPPPWWPDW